MWRPWYETTARVILHLDMNSFFASVEQAHDPSLKGIPMAVAGNPKQRGAFSSPVHTKRVHSAFTQR